MSHDNHIRREGAQDALIASIRENCRENVGRMERSIERLSDRVIEQGERQAEHGALLHEINKGVNGHHKGNGLSVFKLLKALLLKLFA